MLRAIVAVLLILWLLGFVLHIGGSMIHVLAVLGVAVLVYDAISARRKTS
jgi:threonine/homoserine/homoserine lactone efflux protein